MMMISGWPNVGLWQLSEEGDVRDEEEGWIQVLRIKRKKSAGCMGDGELSG